MTAYRLVPGQVPCPDCVDDAPCDRCGRRRRNRPNPEAVDRPPLASWIEVVRWPDRYGGGRDYGPQTVAYLPDDTPLDLVAEVVAAERDYAIAHNVYPPDGPYVVGTGVGRYGLGRRLAECGTPIVPPVVIYTPSYSRTVRYLRTVGIVAIRRTVTADATVADLPVVVPVR